MQLRPLRIRRAAKVMGIGGSAGRETNAAFPIKSSTELVGFDMVICPDGRAVPTDRCAVQFSLLLTERPCEARAAAVHLLKRARPRY